jgi:hypothetical protein
VRQLAVTARHDLSVRGAGRGLGTRAVAFASSASWSVSRRPERDGLREISRRMQPFGVCIP